MRDLAAQQLTWASACHFPYLLSHCMCDLCCCCVDLSAVDDSAVWIEHLGDSTWLLGTFSLYWPH